MPIELTERQRRLVDTALIFAVIALGFIVVGDLANVFYAFGDILLLFFLAWLLSFALLPLINGVTRVVPRIPQGGAVIIVYMTIVILLLAVIIQASASLATSIGQFIHDAPRFEDQLSNLLADVQSRLAALGFQVDLVNQAPSIVENLQQWALELVGPLQSLAVASIGIIGNILILVILSIYIAVDRDAITAFLYRLVPPGFVTEARLLQTSTARSFGGFIRGQGLMGLAMGAVTAVVNIVFGLEYAALTTVAAGVLHAIPFFGPFVSWIPPVAVALLFQPSATLPVLIIMAIGWFVTMNILQPRIMSGAVGIHPIVVLASVIIGLRIAGIPGAIFGIPIAAVLSAFFFHWYGRSRENGTVTDRATKRLAAREGRDVRRPREPVPGVDEDVDEVAGAPAPSVPPVTPVTPSVTTAVPAVTPAAPPPAAIGGEGER
ncbi:MAG TPA: AI-2E family transporter [Candidatus Limnocylindrales bacterium]|nr:AI-2E family transporter [Candidatus Limnocylindrales bacterium]